VRSRKLELQHFLNQHGVDICILSETFLNHSQDIRLTKYVCHRTDRPAAGDGTAFLVYGGVVHHSVPILGLTHLETTAIQVTMAGEKPCGLPLPFPPTDRSGPVRLFRRGNSSLDGRRPQRQTRRLELAAEHKTGKVLRDYADGNSCLIFGPGTTTTNPIQPIRYCRCRDNKETHIPDVPDFVLCAKLKPPPGIQ